VADSCSEAEAPAPAQAAVPAVPAVPATPAPAPSTEEKLKQKLLKGLFK
jgi:hypothetical protein